jgi:nicotinamide-nucleotide amidase
MTRAIASAEILSVGSELLVGETRDTNSGDLAADLSSRGVQVTRMSALPDRLEVVADAFRAALDSVDLVVSTGGLGPTPDDLTREAIAQVCGLEPRVDPELERWLRDMFERRGLAFAATNIKQAWLIDGAESLPNANGTAPGWWVQRPEGKVIVALPGPPREAWPIWQQEVVPRLEARGVGADRYAETLRLTGIGESALVDLIGEERLRAANPVVATYARVDAVDVRISATGVGGHSARHLVEAMLAELLPRLEGFIFARGDETWVDALARRLAGRTLAIVEIGTAGQLGALLGRAEWLVVGELLGGGSPLAAEHRGAEAYATRVREVAHSDVGLAVRVRERGGDTAVTIAVALDGQVTQVTRTAFLGGESGRRRAALLACAELWTRLEPRAGTASAPAMGHR